MSAHRILGVEKTLSSLLKGNLEVINVLKTVKAYQAFLSNEFLGG